MEDRSEDGGLPSDGSRARVESRTASVREAKRRRTRVARRRRNTVIRAEAWTRERTSEPKWQAGCRERREEPGDNR